MHFVYFAEQKLERFYDYLVERTEELTTKAALKEGAGQIDVKGKGVLSSFLARLGPSLEVEANVSASGKLSSSAEIVSRFTASQKLKALLLKLKNERRIAEINDKTISLPNVGTPVAFATWIQVDTTERSESDIEKTEAAILAGHTDNYKIKIQVSLEFMESKNAWRRLQSKRFIEGFGTLIGIDPKECCIEIDPIAFGYAEPD